MKTECRVVCEMISARYCIMAELLQCRLREKMQVGSIEDIVDLICSHFAFNDFA